MPFVVVGIVNKLVAMGSVEFKRACRYRYHTLRAACGSRRRNAARQPRGARLHGNHPLVEQNALLKYLDHQLAFMAPEILEHVQLMVTHRQLQRRFRSEEHTSELQSLMRIS